MEKIHSIVDLMAMGVVLVAAIYLLSQNLIEMDTFIIAIAIMAMGDMIASAIKRVALKDDVASKPE